MFLRHHTQLPAAFSRALPAFVAAAVLAAALTFAAPSAHALTPKRVRDAADRIAIAWLGQQQKNGSFLDPVAKMPTGGYGNVMLGYSLMRAGERRHDESLVRKGVAAVTSGLYEPARFRGVFDELSIAASYNYATSHLARDPTFMRARAKWATYLRGVGQPHTQGVLQACMINPKCFHNHEAAEDLADLELLKTGLASKVPTAKLANPVALRNRVTTRSRATSRFRRATRPPRPGRAWAGRLACCPTPGSGPTRTTRFPPRCSLR